MKVLITGDCHTNDMDIFLTTACQVLGFEPQVDILCHPGGHIDDVKQKIETHDLSPYDSVIVICGGFDVFDDHSGLRCVTSSLKTISNGLIALAAFIRLKSGKLPILTPLLPRGESCLPACDSIALMGREHWIWYNKSVTCVNQHCPTLYQLPLLLRIHNIDGNVEIEPKYYCDNRLYLNDKGKAMLALEWAKLLHAQLCV